MSPPDHKPLADGEHVASRDALKHQDQSARLAHELANLLDGSLRNVGLAITGLDRPDEVDRSPGEPNVLAKLNAASHAMHQMATLLQQWMNSAPPALDSQHGSIGDAVDHAIQLVAPLAQTQQIFIDADVSARAAVLPAGSVFTLVINALRNSVEAFTDQKVRRISLRVDTDGSEVVLTVTDTGPGLDPCLLDARGQFQFGRTTKPAGHGFGLVLCRDIVRGLGGELSIANRSSGGAGLRVRIPIRGHG